MRVQVSFGHSNCNISCHKSTNKWHVVEGATGWYWRQIDELLRSWAKHPLVQESMLSIVKCFKISYWHFDFSIKLYGSDDSVDSFMSADETIGGLESHFLHAVEIVAAAQDRHASKVRIRPSDKADLAACRKIL